MEINEIIALMEAVSANELTSFELEQGETKITMKRENKNTIIPNITYVNDGVAAPTPPYTNSITPVPTIAYANGITDNSTNVTDSSSNISADASDKVVTSPLIGTFYSAPSPEAEPFVKVGDTVTKGQTIGIVEAMKLMNEIECEYDGIVESILVVNEDTVEYGQPLIRIR